MEKDNINNTFNILIIFFIENDTFVLHVYEHVFLLYMYYTWNDIHQNCLTINLNLKKKEIKKKTKKHRGWFRGKQTFAWHKSLNCNQLNE